MILAAHDEESLEKVSSHLHDAWIDIEQIRQEGTVISMPVALRGQRVKKRFLPAFFKAPESYESLLAIRNVVDLQIEGCDQLAVYTLNRLTFAPPHLTVTAEPDCTLTFEVRNLDVEADVRMARYEWHAPGATALAIPLVEAEAVIGELRRAHTPSGREGMPAHAGLLAPFIHASQLSGFDEHAIPDTLSLFRAFDVTLASFGLFERIGCLYLEPDPPEPFVAMSEALLDLYPEVEYPPDGATGIVPHVTVAGRLGPERLEELERQLAQRLPIHARADRVGLFERGAGGRWVERLSYPLLRA